MREKVEIVQIEKVTYIANDGTEFPDKSSCLDHEKRCEEDKLQKIVSKIPSFEYTPEWASFDTSWTWYCVGNPGEFNAVRAVEMHNRDSSAYEYEPQRYPCWLAISVDEYGTGLVEGTVEEVFGVIEEFKKAVLENIKRIGESKNHGETED